ncbi:DUF4124 domain-containing protein [Massilia consociata]|uniref:DUF4124 domain-containing protein n=1 Tax=Massilia consociata TaxID=760117 RepID=A0ABV6FE45_9BURK
MLKHLTFALACLLCQAATAGTIYKCTEAGKTVYSDRPCGSASRVLAVDAAPADPAAAAARLAREQALLKQIEGERAAREEQEARAAARAHKAALLERRRCDKLRLQRRWADEDIARAGRDEAERARIKARRQAEVLAMECPA